MVTKKIKFISINSLISFFYIGFFLDISLPIFSLKSNGETLSQASVLNQDNNLVNSPVASIPIELLDILLIFSFIYLFSKYKKNLLSLFNNIIKVNSIYIKFWFIFCVSIFISILYNFSNYSFLQNIMISLHFIKMIEVGIFSLLIFYFIKNIENKLLIKNFIIITFFCSIVMLLIELDLLNYRLLIGDRMETGIILLITLIFFFFLNDEILLKLKYSKSLIIISHINIFFISTVILFSEKRALVLILILITLILILISLINKKYKFSLILLILSFIISASNISSIIDRSIDDKYDGIKKSAYSSYILEEKMVENSPKNNYLLKFLTNLSFHLDGSGAERIAKIIYTVDLINIQNFFGTGFWGIKYLYDFLPDSSLQILIETGPFGTLFFIIFLVSILLSKSYNSNTKIVKILLLFIISFAGFFCNPIYMFRVMSFFILIIFFINHLYQNVSLNLNEIK